MPFQLMRPLQLKVQIGPFESFAELESAAHQQIPGIVLIPAVDKNATQGQVKGPDGADWGFWQASPFTLVYPLALTQLLGPFDTVDELKAAAAQAIPGAVLLTPAKHARTGEVRDQAGRLAGEWMEFK